MTDEKPRDVPPVYLPEPELPPPPLTQRADDVLDRPVQSSRGQRFDAPERESHSRQGIPNWLIWVGMVGLLAIGMNEGSPIPILIGAAIFFLLHRRNRR